MSTSIYSGSILVVEDEPSYREDFKTLLSKLFPNFRIEIVVSLEQSKQIIDQNIPFDIVLTDMRLVDVHGKVNFDGGIEVVQHARAKDRMTQIIVITNHPKLGNICRALSEGASYYIDRTVSGYQETLELLIRKALDYKNAIIALNDFVKVITSTIDAKDKYTKGHSERVKEYSIAIADHLSEMTAVQRAELTLSALLHDIGKMGINNCLLHKPGRFTDLERQLMREHTRIGAEILEEMQYFKNIVDGVESHHTNYWDEKKNQPTEGLSLYARIIAVADSFDAITSSRAYREKQPLEWAQAEIQRCQGSDGKQFDPSIVTAFNSAFVRIKEIYNVYSRK